jgi:NADH:ubiquinone oxidoreductase subunit 6 (subunit J)
MLFFFKGIEFLLLLGVLWTLIALLMEEFLLQKLFNLILLFVFIAFWLLFRGFEFLPFIMLIIYVGSIAVLFLFVVMIINPDYIDLQLNQYSIKYLWTREELELERDPWLYYSGLGDTKVNEVALKKINLSDANSVDSPIYFLVYGFIGFFVMLVGLLGFVSVDFSLLPYDSVNLLALKLGVNSCGVMLSNSTDIFAVARLLYLSFGVELLLMGFILFVAMVFVIMFGARKSIAIKRQNTSEQNSRA